MQVGITTKEINNAPSNAQGSNRIMTIVGSASSTYVIADLEVNRGSGSTDTITGTQVSDVSSFVGCGSLPGLYNYVRNTDFTVTNNVITWLSTSNKPSVGSIYYVTYNQTKGSSFYQPTTISDPNLVESMYGTELSNGVVSEVTLGAKLAFGMGASQVICLQTSATDTATEKAAIDLLETEDTDIIIAPHMCDITMQSYIFGHCLRMSTDSEKKERQFWTNSYTSSLDSNDQINSAIAFDNDAVTMITPPTVNIVMTDSVCNIDLTVSVPSAFAGCALAGVTTNANNDEATPLTRVQLLGIDSVNGKWKESVMDQMDANGLLILENKNGIIRVHHAITTSTKNVNETELEIKILRCQVRKDLRALFEPYIGQKYIPTTTNAQLASALVNFCNQKVVKGIFVSFSDIVVVQSPGDPRVALISFSFVPVYTLTAVQITYSLKF